MTSRKGAVDLEVVRGLTLRTVETRLRSPRGVTEYVFKGPLLFDYAVATAMLPPEGALASQYFVASAEDGFTVAVAMAEVAPDYTSKRVILAIEQNGEPMRAGLRLVVPGDDLGGRSVFGLSSLELRGVASVPLSDALHSDGLELLGDIERPRRLDIAALNALTLRDVEPVPSKGHGEKVRPRRTFRGVPVWELLEGAGLRYDPALREPFLPKIVVASDADGYAVVIAGGEIEPRFLAAPFIVATRDASGPLGDSDGGLRLIAPHDLAGARSVKAIASLEVRDA
jgi:DMSO/TMAO reductase YedYZ molybdopterin-dependent catalytic subunit